MWVQMITTISVGRYMHWYVNVENQAYGPYSDDKMRGFVAEGRVTTASLISHAPENGFYGAGEFDEFNLWCDAAQQTALQPLVAVGAQAGVQGGTAARHTRVQTLHQETIQPSQQSGKQLGQNQVADAKTNVFLIMAEIRSDGEMAFLQTMQNFGQAERIGDTVWLVRTSNSVEHIRNTLSQTLNQQDRLFILDSKAGKTAWFNIGADLDHRIRELWDEGEG